jgi:hypothetical protein
VHVRLFADRLEVSSPGSWLGRDLPAGKDYDLAELAGHSVKRNFRLANVLSWVRLVEGEGSGIPSAIRACRADQSPTPTVREEQGLVTVILRRRSGPRAAATPVAQLEAALSDLRARAGIPGKGLTADSVATGDPAVRDGLNGNRILTWPAVERLIRRLGGDEQRVRALWELAAMSESVQGEADPTADASFLARYRQHLAQVHGRLEPPDFERRRLVPMKDLYVPQTVIQVTDVDPQDPPVPISLWALAERIDRTVLLGDPGGEKTTAANALLAFHAGDAGRLVPFLVTLREFAAQDQPDRSVAGYIEQRLHAFYQCPARAGLVDQLLLTGQAMVIFDGLDELLDGSRRSEVAAIVEQFCAEYPLARVLVTSRIVGYDQARLDDRQFSVYRLGSLSDEQVGEYARKWFLLEAC